MEKYLHIREEISNKIKWITETKVSQIISYSYHCKNFSVIKFRFKTKQNTISTMRDMLMSEEENFDELEKYLESGKLMTCKDRHFRWLIHIIHWSVCCTI